MEFQQSFFYIYLRNSSYLFWPGRGVSSFGQVQVVLQQQRVRGVEKWKGFHPDRTQVKLKLDMIQEKQVPRQDSGKDWVGWKSDFKPDWPQVWAWVPSKVLKGLRKPFLHRGECHWETGGGLRLPGEQLRFLDFKIFGFHPLLVLQIVPTGKPSPLTACQIVNKTLTSLKVQCQEGESNFFFKSPY